MKGSLVRLPGLLVVDRIEGIYLEPEDGGALQGLRELAQAAGLQLAPVHGQRFEGKHLRVADLIRDEVRVLSLELVGAQVEQYTHACVVGVRACTSHPLNRASLGTRHIY